MSTTPSSDRQSARERLLHAADRLFYGHGINATGVDAVVREADVARNTLYYQFGGKDQLVAAYLRDRDGRWRRHWSTVVGRHPDPVGRALAIFEALEDWDGQGGLLRGCAFVDAAAELAEQDHPAHAVIRTHWHGLKERLTVLVAHTGADDAAGLGEDLLIIYRGALAAMLTEPRRAVLDRATQLGHRTLAAAS